MTIGTIELILECLVGRDYERIAKESDLQAQVEQRLRLANLEFTSQVELDSRADRIDVLCCSIGIELKISGGVSAVLAQLERYAQSDLVSEIVLVTTRASHLNLRGIGPLHGKPVYVIVVGSL